MNLSDANNQIIDRIPPPDALAESARHERWLRMSGPAEDDADYLPIAVCTAGKPMLDGIPEYDFPLAEQVDDPEKMLYQELVRLLGLTRFPGDQTMGVFPRFGNSFLLTVLGLNVRIIENTCWPARYLSREEARDLALPNDLSAGNMLGRAVEYIQHCKTVLPEHIPTGLFFMMSPYDLAALIRGDEQLLLDMYDAPDDVHRLMGLCCDLFVNATLLLKQETDEPADFFRYNAFTLAGGGMLCEDCPIVLSPEMHREFCIPYTRRALDAIGGGWVHWCGNGGHLIDNYLEIDNLYGFQFGQLELNGVYEETAAKITGAGKALNMVLGGLRQKQSWPEHCRTMLAPLTRRKFGYTTVFPGANGGEAMMQWRAAQDECLG